MTDVELHDDETLQRFLAAADEEVREIDSDEVTLQIISRILHAEDVDDILGGGSLTHARDMLNVPFALTGVRFNRSDMGGDGPAFYAVLEGADDNGEKVLVSCGARNVIAQAWKLRDIDALPIRVQIEESDRPTSNGFKVMWLAKAPATF